MGYRLSRLATRTGDDGTTGLANGSRHDKHALRIEAIGTVDELNSALGLLGSESLPPDLHTLLADIQHDLFDLGGELALPGHTLLTATQSLRLDEALAHYNATLPPLTEFVLPAGARPAALAHMARTICRRAERSVVAVARAESISEHMLPYLNRLSDLLFVVARVLNRAAGVMEFTWQQGKNRDG